MTEYEEFMKHLEMHNEEQWIDLTEIVEFFPGVNRKTIDRLLYNNRIELDQKQDGTQRIRLTAKGRDKLIKQYSVKNPTLLGLIAMAVIIFMFKVAPKITGVYLDEVPKSYIPVDPRVLLDSIAQARVTHPYLQLDTDSNSESKDTQYLNHVKEDSIDFKLGSN